MNLNTFLAEAIKNEIGFAEAEMLYSESFKAEETFSVEDGFWAREDLVEYLMADIVRYNNPFDDFAAVIKEGYSREEAEFMVDRVRFVEICNYKGESEGFELVERASTLRTFYSKYNYR